MSGFEVNEAIKPKFLDMKEGAVVVSLQSFVTTGRGSERNVSVLINFRFFCPYLTFSLLSILD